MILDLIQFLIITQTFSAEIVYSFNTNNSNINEWKQYTSGQPCTLIACEDINLINNKASKIFINLKPHYMITLQIEIWSYQSSLELLIDSISQIFPSKVPAVITCSGQPTFIYQITYSIPHYRKTLWISIVSQGLVSFTLSLEACPDQCEFCTDYDFQECIQWHLHFSTFTNYYIDTFEGWDITSANNVNLLDSKMPPKIHIYHQTQEELGYFFFISFKTFKTFKQVNKLIQLYNKQVYEKQFYYTHFFDSQPIYFEEQFLSLKFVQFVMLRDFEIYYKVKIESFSYFLNPFVPGCNQLIKQTCFSCYDGWTYNEYSNQCIIDQLLPSPTISEEEIDENNEEQNDENHKENHEEVQEEFIFQEICDNHCLDCKNNVCTQCDIDFNLIEDNEKSKLFCRPKNQSCQKNCKDCLETDCLECVQGFEIVNGKCVGKCGDQLIVENEDCDDGNEIQYDGCYQCKYSCVVNCKDCLEGKCESCSEQYELEDVFYNNNDPNDEFYQNQVESNWVCISDNQNYISQCSFIEYPIFVVEFKNYTHNKQYVQVRYAKYVDQDFFSVLSQE